MSRNKDIKLLHEVTGLSYKECRARMKRYGWDFTAALFEGYRFVLVLQEGVDTFMKALEQAVLSTAQAVEAFGEALSGALNNVKLPKDKS